VADERLHFRTHRGGAAQAAAQFLGGDRARADRLRGPRRRHQLYNHGHVDPGKARHRLYAERRARCMAAPPADPHHLWPGAHDDDQGGDEHARRRRPRRPPIVGHDPQLLG
jgi:hypothetical protein